MEIKNQVLQHQFRRLSKNLNEEITREQIFDFLDQQSGGLFDHSVAMQLYQRSIRTGQLTIRSFIQAYLEAEQVLTRKISQTKNQIQLCEQSKRLTENSLKKIQEEQSSTNEMTLCILDFDIQRLTISQRVQFIVICEDNSYQTSELGTEFTFPIKKGNEEIKIMINIEQYGSSQNIGECKVKVDDFSDQFEKNLALHIDSRTHQGTVSISGQWIFSKAIYMRDVLKNQEDQFESYRQDLKDYEIDLETLYKPFPQLIEPSEIPVIPVPTSPAEPVYDQPKLIKINVILYLYFTCLVCLCSFDRTLFLDVQYIVKISF